MMLCCGNRTTDGVTRGSGGARRSDPAAERTDLVDDHFVFNGFPILTATTDVALRKIGSHTAGNGDLLEGIVEAGEAFGTSSASAREFTGAYLCKGLVQPRIFSVDVAGSTGGRASQEPNSPIAVQLSGKSEAQRSPNCRPQPMEDIIFPASSPGFDVKPVPCRINVDRERRTPTPSDPTAGQCHSGGRGARHLRKGRTEALPQAPLSPGGACSGQGCDHCGRKSSPVWRRGPAGKQRLCNACGVRYHGKGTLEGYMPGMKQRDDNKVEGDLSAPIEEDVCDDTDSAKTTMPQLSGRTQGRGQRTPRRNTTPRSDAVCGPPVVTDAESDDGEAGSLSSWVDYGKQALRCYGHDSDKAWRFLKMALDRAKTESMASSQFLSDLLSELNRVNGLYWMDKERSMALLANLVDGEADRSMSVGAEALLTLSGVAPLMEDCSKEVPAGCDGAPVDGPSWALCVSCGRARQTKRWLPVWWRFTCGDPEATNPRLTCRDSSTFSPTKESVRPAETNAVPKRSRSQVPYRGSSLGSNPMAAHRDHQMEGGMGGTRSGLMEPKEVLDLVDPDDAECFRHLPPGWRLELMFERVGEPPGYEFRVYYMSPDGFGPFCSPEEVAAHLSSPRFCNWQGSGTFAPGPAFHRSHSGSVLVSHYGNMTATHGFQGAVCIGGVPCPDSPRLVRNDVSLSYLPLAIGQLPSDLSPAATPEPRPGLGTKRKKPGGRSGNATRPRKTKHIDVEAFTFPVRTPGMFAAGAPGVAVNNKPLLSAATCQAAERGGTPPQQKLSSRRQKAKGAAAAHSARDVSPGRLAKAWSPMLLAKQRSEPTAKLQDMGGACSPAAAPATPCPAAAASTSLGGPAPPVAQLNAEQASSAALPSPANPTPALKRGLFRAVSEPTSAEKAFAACEVSPRPQPAAAQLKEVAWKGALLMSHGDEAEQEMICALDASLPPDAAEQLPPRLLISSIQPRREIFSANAGDEPVLMRLAACTEGCMETIRHMEETKMAAVVHLKAFDFALIPHTNVKNGIHIIGLKLKSTGMAISPS